MCIIFCYIAKDNPSIGYDLILLSNRDESFQRPASEAHVWPNTKYLLGGQDQTPSREGGTWLALNSVQSRIGVLLNLTSNLFPEKISNPLSRGFLVTNYVNNPENNLDFYMDELQKNKLNYTGFNFLGLERDSNSNKWKAKYINNLSDQTIPMKIDTSIFGFSNHLYGDEHAFEKTKHGCQLLKSFISGLTENHTKIITDEKELIRQCLDLLYDNTIFSEDVNLNTVYSHYSINNRHQISSIHVRTTEELPTYGTRTSTVILVRHDQTGVFVEKTLRNPLINPLDWTISTWHFNLNNTNEPPILIN